uniref:DNA-binding transcriptional regulator, MarR family n=1 Tax=Candidatus Kentrum sp. LPFa TaxID=2126335 RepID=A0A450XEX1_9GAMM|nr:MAG: DNA-binding transcriptional regulator, MarR family [Candidatus Kentron sp. LPFa]
MSKSNWASVKVLRHFWLDAGSAEPLDPRIEGAFQAVTEDLVDAVMPNGEERLAIGQRDLRALFLAINATEQGASAESSPAFAVGRLVGLLDIAENAIRRVWIGSTEAKIEHDHNALKIIEELHRREGALVISTDIAQYTGLDKAEVSRKLAQLESLRLVTRSRLGRYLVSRLTSAGASFAARRFAEKERSIQHVFGNTGKDQARQSGRRRSAASNGRGLSNRLTARSCLPRTMPTLRMRRESRHANSS